VNTGFHPSPTGKKTSSWAKQFGNHAILRTWKLSTHGRFNPLNTKVNPICHLLALFGSHHILHVCRIRVNLYVNNRNIKKNSGTFLACEISHVSRIARLWARYKLHTPNTSVTFEVIQAQNRADAVTLPTSCLCWCNKKTTLRYKTARWRAQCIAINTILYLTHRSLQLHIPIWRARPMALQYLCDISNKEFSNP